MCVSICTHTSHSGERERRNEREREKREKREKGREGENENFELKRGLYTLKRTPSGREREKDRERERKEKRKRERERERENFERERESMYLFFVYSDVTGFYTLTKSMKASKFAEGSCVLSLPLPLFPPQRIFSVGEM